MNPQGADTSITDESNVVPESLLAFAKDSRYLEECKTLLLQLLRKALPSRGEDLLDRDAWYASAVLYTAIVLLRRGRTLGMEVCGLKYPERIARWKVVAASLAAASTVYTLHLHRATVERDSASSTPSTESLHGIQRRQFYERQRLAMLHRANGASDISSPMRNEPSLAHQQSATHPSSFRERIRKAARELLHSIVTAVFSFSRIEGPHAPTETQQRTITMGIWVLRLHLAYYCLTGRYPSWTHRLVGHTIEEDGSKRLVSRPNNFRVVGLLILAQAAGTTIQNVSQQLTHWWIDHSVPNTSRQTPSITFEGEGQSLKTRSATIGVTCGICQQARTHPACPASCGHVFCWKCLQLSVASRAECPLCRTACQPQDILALHNYTP